MPTKQVPCSYSKCSGRRAHFARPEENRPHQTIEVLLDYDGPAYCSIECMAYDGVLKKNHQELQEIAKKPPSRDRIEEYINSPEGQAVHKKEIEKIKGTKWDS